MEGIKILFANGEHFLLPEDYFSLFLRSRQSGEKEFTVSAGIDKIMIVHEHVVGAISVSKL